MKKVAPKKSSLEQALDFLSLAYKAGETQSTYCFMELGTAICFNMIIGVGTRIEEDIAACPHVGLLRSALDRCGTEYVITQLSTEKLLVRSGEFHAYIPCLEAAALAWCQPDAALAPLDDRFREALEKVAGLAVTKADSVLECSIQLNAGSVIATNRRVILEAWHGIDFPDGLLMPKVAFAKLNKVKKRLQSFGFSPTSLTLYFEDGSWLFTKLFQDKWPANVKEHLSIDNQSHPIDESFFAAVKKVLPFSSSGAIWVEGNMVSSHPPFVKEEGSGLSLPFDGLQFEPRTYVGSDLLFVSHYATKWDANARNDGTSFFGNNLRGIIHHGNFSIIDPTGPTDDEDIPF